MINVVVSPSNYNENYTFPVGRHRVTWTGTSDSGIQKSCSFHITVVGEKFICFMQFLDLVLDLPLGTRGGRR